MKRCQSLLPALLWALVGLLGACTSSPAAEGPATANPQPVAQAQAVAAPAPEPSAPAFDINYLTGHFDPATHPDFVKVDKRYTRRDDFYLHRSAYEAFERMYAAALRDNIRLEVLSATRNFNRQKQIWEAKWRGDRKLEGGETAPQAYPDPAQRALAILRYSSMPGASRHHWGTDLDLVALNNEFFAQGEGKRIYDWLIANAPGFGFCQPYSPKGADRPHGYEEEKWHWSYLPLSQPLTALAGQQLRNEDIKGFEGAETTAAIDVVNKYVLGINPICK